MQIQAEQTTNTSQEAGKWEALGWSLCELARRLSGDDGTVRQMATDKRPVPDNLAAWLELVHAVWGILTPELCDIARRMECDRGTFRFSRTSRAELVAASGRGEHMGGTLLLR